MGDCSKDMEHQFAGDRGRIDAFIEADEVDVVRLEVLDRFEQFLERATEADDDDASKADGEARIGGRGRCPSSTIWRFNWGSPTVSGRLLKRCHGRVRKKKEWFCENPKGREVRLSTNLVTG